MNRQEQRCFLQGLALGRSLQGVSFHGPLPGAVGIHGFPGAAPRMGEACPAAQSMVGQGLVSGEACMGRYTARALQAEEG